MKRLFNLSIVIVLLVGMLPAAVAAQAPEPGKPNRPEKKQIETAQIQSEPFVQSGLLAATTSEVDVLLVVAGDDASLWGDPTWSRLIKGLSTNISPHGGLYLASFDSSTYTGAERLQTGPLDLSGTSSPQVSFWMSHNSPSPEFNDQLQVQISTDGLNWTDVGAPFLRVDPACENACWQQHTLDLPEYYIGNPVYIGFLGDSLYGYDITLDDVAVFDGSTSILEEGFENSWPPEGWSQAIAPWGGGRLERVLEAYGDLGAVDHYDARNGTPTLSDLQAYDVVLTWSEYNYNDPTTLGDVLADYIIADGKVINLSWSMDPDTGGTLGGRFVSQNYVAMWGPSGLTSMGLCLGEYDSSHPIMQGISDVCDGYTNSAGLTLTSGSSAIAWWSDGALLVAAKDNRTVVSINAYDGFWAGHIDDKDALVHNAIWWLAAGTDPDITVYPAELNAEQCPGSQTQQTFQVCNRGQAALNWSLFENDTGLQPVSLESSASRLPQTIEMESTGLDWGDSASLVAQLPAAERQVGTALASAPAAIEQTSAAAEAATLWEQPVTSGSGVVSSHWGPESDLAEWGAFSADDFIVTEIWLPTTFVVYGAYAGDLHSASSLSWCWFSDTNGFPDSYPSSSCFTFSPNDPPVTIDDTTNPGTIEIRLDIAEVFGEIIPMDPGHWWLAFFVNNDSLETPEFFWLPSGTTNAEGAALYDPTSAYGGSDSWTRWTDNAGPHDLAFKVKGSVLDLTWLSEDPTSGTLSENQCADVTVTFDSTGVFFEEYGQVVISSNDPDEPATSVYTTLSALPNPGPVDFGWSPPNPEVNQEITLSALSYPEFPVTITWDFGDTGTGDGPVTAHTYSTSGNYNVGLTVDSTEVASFCPANVQKTVTVYEPLNCTDVLFDDFESGFGNWTMSGLWNEESESDTCGALVAPFPSPVNAAYFGGQIYNSDACTYFTDDTVTGELSLAADLDLSAGVAADLQFASWEQTECSDPTCGYDKRYVELSSDGGNTWMSISQLTSGGGWYTPLLGLTEYKDSPLRLRFRFDSVDPVSNYYLGWMLDDVRVRSCTTGDVTPPNLNITGAAADGVPLAGDLANGYILPTAGDPAVDHLIQFAAETNADETLADDYFGLYLVSSTVTPVDLKAYYDARGVPEAYLTYLKAAADGTNPFVYIKGSDVTLVDAAKHDLQAVDVAMTVPDDYPPGTYIVQGQITDLVGNPTSVTLILVVSGDRTPPDTTITASPTDPSSSADASFSFTSEAGATFECQLDSGGFSTCTSPKTYTALADGNHTFEVQATDGAGNTDPSPASFTWTIDTVAPDTSITSNPADPSNDVSPSFSFTSTESGSIFKCQLDGGGFTACTSPKTYATLVDGSHTFEVRATDSAGNTDPTPASFNWTIDTAAPDTTITGHPLNPSNIADINFYFSSSETGSTFQCQRDGGGFSGCTSPQTYHALTDGSHTFDVKATDSAGNTDSTLASFTWTIDTLPPNTTITSNPANPSNDSSPSFSFTSTESGSIFECQLDSGGFSTCTSPKTYASLADGSHTFTVRATDSAGNTDPTPASFTWMINTSLPTMSVSDILITSKPSRGIFTITGIVTVVDSIGNFLSRVALTVDWFQDDELVPLRTAPTSNTNRSGVANFVLRKMPAGVYQLCVTNLVKPGYTWVPGANDCDTVTVGP